MTDFFATVRAFEPTPEEARARRWIYVPYDRLHDGVGPLAETAPEDAVVVLMESRAKGTRRPYHKKKLVLVLSAMRHFALEQAERAAKWCMARLRAASAMGCLSCRSAGSGRN